MRGANKIICVACTVVFLQAARPVSGSNIQNKRDSCIAVREWFPQTPPPANSRPDPDSDCAFYKWAWQAFLFVTQPGEGKDRPRFIDFSTRSELNSAKNDQVDGVKTFIPRDLAAIRQAGSLGMVIDQSGRVLYYAAHFNDEFAKFVRDNALTRSAQLTDVSSDLQFPKGSLELKSSWKVVAAGDDVRRFFTIKTSVPVFKLSSDGEMLVDTSRSRQETLALLGMHIVGIVEGHPEFIWATFEHNDNAPDLPVGLSPRAARPVDSTRSWTLYAKGAKASDCNNKPAKSGSLKRFDEQQQTWDATVSVFREFAFGGDDEPEDINRLNDSVHRLLPPELAIWKNYSFMGAMWLNDPDRDFKENSDFNGTAAAHPERKVLGGDARLSNVTMETFTQSIQNCFSCHNTMAKAVGHQVYVPGRRLNMSHALTATASRD